MKLNFKVSLVSAIGTVKHLRAEVALKALDNAEKHVV